MRTTKRKAAIDVRQTGHGDPLAFDVTVRESGSESRHHVTVSRADYDRLTSGRCPPARCIESAMRFLLDREPKESILSRFDVSVIARYFPQFDREWPGYIGGSAAEADGS